MVGCRAPSQRITTVPVGAAYRSELRVYAERAPRLAVGHLRAVEERVQPGGRGPPRSAGPWRRPAASRARRPRGRAPPRRTRCTAAPTAGRATGPPTSTARSPRRARGSRGARLGACCPAGPPTPRAGASARPRGSRSSSAPTCRRNARICSRVRSSRGAVMTSHLRDEPCVGVRGRLVSGSASGRRSSVNSGCAPRGRRQVASRGGADERNGHTAAVPRDRLADREG